MVDSQPNCDLGEKMNQTAIKRSASVQMRWLARQLIELNFLCEKQEKLEMSVCRVKRDCPTSCKDDRCKDGCWWAATELQVARSHGERLQKHLNTFLNCGYSLQKQQEAIELIRSDAGWSRRILATISDKDDSFTRVRYLKHSQLVAILPILSRELPKRPRPRWSVTSKDVVIPEKVVVVFASGKAERRISSRIRYWISG